MTEHRCIWCGITFERKRGKRNKCLYCSKQCRGWHRRAVNGCARAVAQYERDELKRQRSCLQCGQPMDVVGQAWVHPECRRVRAAAWYAAHHVSVAIRIRRHCFWCEQPFITRNRRSTFCSKRCGHRWTVVCHKHGLDRHTDRIIIRSYRLLGNAYYAIQAHDQSVASR